MIGSECRNSVIEFNHRHLAKQEACKIALIKSQVIRTQLNWKTLTLKVKVCQSAIIWSEILVVMFMKESNVWCNC